MEEFKGDKRTKEYKEWKAQFDASQEAKPDGIGDVVKSITKATGIDKLVKFIAGEDCGCDERAVLLNKIYPFNKPKCLNEVEFNFLTEFFKTRKTRVTFDERKRLYEIHNRIFSTALKNTSCPSCVLNLIRKLETILKTYK